MGSSASKITAQDRSVLHLKQQRDKLRQYQQRIETVLAREQEIARQALSQGNKPRALIALRQKKYQQTLLAQTDSQLETLQKLVSSIEFSLVEKDILYGLQQGTAVLKQLNQEMNLDRVEQLLSDSAEGIAYQKEVGEMLQSKMSAAEEEEVQDELLALQAEQIASTLPSAPITTLPEPVPSAELPPVAAEPSKEPERQRTAMLA